MVGHSRKPWDGLWQDRCSQPAQLCSFTYSSLPQSFIHSFFLSSNMGLRVPLCGAGGMWSHKTDTVPAPGQDLASLWGPDNKKWHIL